MIGRKKHCRHCGTNIADNAIFCGSCGASTQAPAPQMQTNVRTPSNLDQILMAAKGVNGQLELLSAKLRIRRKGMMALATQGLKGDKEIYIDQISSIQLKGAGLTNGYIQFSFLGGQETKSGIFDATKDENTIMFTKKHQPEFEAAKGAVEQKLHEIRSSRAQPMQQAIPEDIPSQIQKLAQLRAQGILTDAEFNQKKQELLARM